MSSSHSGILHDTALQSQVKRDCDEESNMCGECLTQYRVCIGGGVLLAWVSIGLTAGDTSVQWFGPS